MPLPQAWPPHPPGGGRGAVVGLRHGVGAGIVFRCLHISRSRRILLDSGRGAVVGLRHRVGAGIVSRCLHVSRSRCILLGGGRGAVVGLRHGVGAGIVFLMPLPQA